MFIFVMLSQAWPQEKVQESLRKNSYLYSQNVETGACHAWPHEKDSRVVKKQKVQDQGENIGHYFYWGFHRKVETR